MWDKDLNMFITTTQGTKGLKFMGTICTMRGIATSCMIAAKVHIQLIDSVTKFRSLV